MATKKLTGNHPDEAMQLAQLEKIQLENQKLKREQEEFEKPKEWQVVVSQFIPLIAAIISVAGFLWGIYQYRAQQAENLEAQRQQAKRELETTQRAFMQPWLTSQREIYLQALTAASTIANSSDTEQLQQATEDFWKLFHGQMILVETEEVKNEMIHFGNCLNNHCSQTDLNEQLHKLANTMADSMAATAQMTYEQFSANQFRYISKPSPTR